MMTTTARMTAASDIARGINHDLDMSSSMPTRDQVCARVNEYCDDPATTPFDKWCIVERVMNAMP